MAERRGRRPRRRLLRRHLLNAPWKMDLVKIIRANPDLIRLNCPSTDYQGDIIKRSYRRGLEDGTRQLWRSEQESFHDVAGIGSVLYSFRLSCVGPIVEMIEA